MADDNFELQDESDSLLGASRPKNEEDSERKDTAKNPRRSKGGVMGLRDRRGEDKPAELFRKDLISAMKMGDMEQLTDVDYLVMADAWRQEWEKGVQVPVNHSQKESKFSEIGDFGKMYGSYPYKMPKKLLYSAKDEFFQNAIHELHETQTLAEGICRYDLDDLDVKWLETLNTELSYAGDDPIDELVLEKVLEELETQCYNTMEQKMKTVEGLGIEYDEDVVCDVCMSPDAEEENEMLFCDNCDVCVHQACYGISRIPEGSWLCRPCSIGVRPQCILCPRPGGALKATKKGSKWAHVSCSLWIPEVSIGSPEKMEPVTKISQIPASRWSLTCHVCRQKQGACIQCHVKNCKVAFHVTCAFQERLRMDTIMEERADGENDVSLKAYCTKHSRPRSAGGACSPLKPGSPQVPRTPRKDEMTEEQRKAWREERLKEFEDEFYLCVNPFDIAKTFEYSTEVVDFIYNYWILKRKANFNLPLLTPKTAEADQLAKQREDSIIARMKMFLHLRQDLERVRNLCYMVTRREKTRRSFYKTKQEIFLRQIALLSRDNIASDLSEAELQEARVAHRSTLLYDDYERIRKLADEHERVMDSGALSFSYTMQPAQTIPKPQGDEYIPVVKSRRGRHMNLAKVARGELSPKLRHVHAKRGRKPKFPKLDDSVAQPAAVNHVMEDAPVDVVGLDTPRSDVMLRSGRGCSESTEPAESLDGQPPAGGEAAPRAAARGRSQSPGRAPRGQPAATPGSGGSTPGSGSLSGRRAVKRTGAKPTRSARRSLPMNSPGSGDDVTQRSVTAGEAPQPQSSEPTPTTPSHSVKPETGKRKLSSLTVCDRPTKRRKSNDVTQEGASGDGVPESSEQRRKSARLTPVDQRLDADKENGPSPQLTGTKASKKSAKLTKETLMSKLVGMNDLVIADSIKSKLRNGLKSLCEVTARKKRAALDTMKQLRIQDFFQLTSQRDALSPRARLEQQGLRPSPCHKFRGKHLSPRSAARSARRPAVRRRRESESTDANSLHEAGEISRDATPEPQRPVLRARRIEVARKVAARKFKAAAERESSDDDVINGDDSDDSCYSLRARTPQDTMETASVSSTSSGGLRSSRRLSRSVR